MMSMTRMKLQNVFQDRTAFKNAVYVFVIVSLEDVVSRLGITCENATLWLVFPPCVIFAVSCLRSKNVTLLFNCETSKSCSCGIELFARCYVALLYLTLPAMTWLVAAFLNGRVWVCYKMGLKDCGITIDCTLEQEHRWNQEKRVVEAQSQNIALVILTGCVLLTTLLTWGYHLLFARPEKEREVDDLARDAARTVLENFATERAKENLQEIKAMIETEAQYKQALSESTQSQAERRLKSSSSTIEIESKWFEQLEKNIRLHLEDHLITSTAKLVYPEV